MKPFHFLVVAACSFLAPLAHAQAQSALVSEAPTAQAQPHTGAAMGQSTFNPFAPTAGNDASGHVEHGLTIAFDPTNPASWAMWVNPKTHSKMHMAFSNPAQYAQFMRPEFYMQFMNPNTAMAWMNPASYAVFMDPATWMYWMQPGAYMHGMNPANYMQMMNPAAYASFMNPATYMSWMNPATYGQPVATEGATAGHNPFDLTAWAKMFDPMRFANAAKTPGDKDSGETEEKQ